MRPTLTAAAAALVLLAGPALAQGSGGGGAPEHGRGAALELAGSAGAGAYDRGGRGGGMSLDQAVDMVQRRFNARVVRAEESREGDEVVYRIRLLSNDGRVFTVTVDARSGQVH